MKKLRFKSLPKFMTKLYYVDLKHISETYEGPITKVTLTRIKRMQQMQLELGIVCYDCRRIYRKLGILKEA